MSQIHYPLIPLKRVIYTCVLLVFALFILIKFSVLKTSIFAGFLLFISLKKTFQFLKLKLYYTNLPIIKLYIL